MYFFLNKAPFFLGLFFLFTGCSSVVFSLKPASVFSDHMVLQQLSDVPLWGKGRPGALVKIDTDWGQYATANVDTDGNWMTTLKTPIYGGPYSVRVKSISEQIEFKDVLIGEVWLTSGQSNMEWPMNARILNQEEEIQNANIPNIRMFSVPRNLNGTNINTATWKVTTPENVIDFSAVGYFFAREVYENIQVPIGILNSSWGGTFVEAWTSIERLASIEASAAKANEIIEQGGLSEIQKNRALLNEEIVQTNEAFLKAKSFSVPESISDWQNLQLDDQQYATVSYDDQDWDKIEITGLDQDLLTFEYLFPKESFAEDGVIWFRKKFDVKNPEESYRLIAEGGIDDFDYTYLNGKRIGVGLSCCTDRRYEIPKGLLKKKGNVLAIRVLDTGGEGAFRGPLYLESKNDRLQFDEGLWKFKHLAFHLDTSIQRHNLSSLDLIQKDSMLKTRVKKGFLIQNPNMYSILYNFMIKPIMPYKVKGFLWYQGESNVGNHEEYQSLFSGMIQDWREKWNAILPFYFVQIAPFQYTVEDRSQALRDAQRKTLALEKTGMAITLDIGEEKDIHPANKQDVGKRLARLALANDYGKSDILASGPLYAYQKIYDSYIDVYFDYVGSGLMKKDTLDGFEIAGEDQVFYPAFARIIKDRVRVLSKQVSNPKHVRYGWKNYFEASLFNKAGLPASSFRTF